MAIPNFQTIMLPLLQLASDGKAHNVVIATEKLAQSFNLTEDEKLDLIPSGSPRFYNRVSWAKTHLKKAGLINYPQRGYFQITNKGCDVLKEKPSEINMKYLMRFDEYVEFRKAYQAGSKEEHNDEDEELTPEEEFDKAYQKIRNDLADELLDTILKCSPSFFEKLVLDLLFAMGYGGTQREATRSIGRSGDGGVDGVIDEDRLGLENIYIQAKRWQPENKVGRPQIQAFVGALTGKNARKGVFISTSDFTNDARNYVKSLNIKVVLINGDRLTNHLIDFGVGLSTRSKYEIKHLDSDYFELES